MNLKVAATGAQTLIVKRFCGPFWIRRRWLNRTQWLSAEELLRVQLRLLRQLIRHCYHTVPFYRRIMDERRICADDIQDLEDIKLFPILTKKDVLQAGESIVSTKYPGWFSRQARTGGTTGTPMKIYRDVFSIGNEHAFVRRQWDWAGVRLRDRCAWIIAGRRIADPNRGGVRPYAYDPFMKELTLSVYHLSAETAPRYAEVINRYRVKAIVGISSAVYFLARMCLDLGMKVRLRAALTTSEILSDHMRSIIAEAFQCPVFDFYGAAERVCYIHACEHGTYHVIPEYGYTELIPQQEPIGGQHRIVATGFWNFAMPLLRYDTGDSVLVSNKTCKCGRSFPIVDSIVGRDTDVIRTPSGREYGPTIVARVVKCADNILESQVVQDAVDHISVLYVPGKMFTEKDLEDFKKTLSRYFPSELRVELKGVERIPRTDAGKTKLVVSEI